MLTVTAFSESRFSKDEIEKQVGKIIADPVFIDSDILKRFLLFIVEKTLYGNSNQLKEYTIAVNVLDKPADFNPHENGIVRIHASRLRRALNSYYSKKGIFDTIRIAVPKGGYVPMFSENDDELASRVASSQKKVVIGVAPFRNASNNKYSNSFANGLCLQLSKELMQQDNYSVVAFYVMQNLAGNFSDFKQMATAGGIHMMITGEVQLFGTNLRVHIEIIRIRTGCLHHSFMFERKFSQDKAFDLQDEIVRLVVKELSRNSVT